ncbi:Uncharacterised protein [Pantoea agglomerans]|uniref:Uncharacterized protein n=1 Tax=Enterobacter agglomerans TaxID=549 RepID=A0A379AEW9_ENTAG|nr:Uncharacterised protein [Pantoea agglomerans]
MKRAILWLIQSFFYLLPAAVIVAGVYIFICFVPQYAALLSFAWVIVVSYVYIKFNRWY